MSNKYLGLSDEELIKMYNEGDESACDELLFRYKNLVRKKAKAMFIAGGDSDDLIQEGMIGLYKAIRDYEDDKQASFMTFASMCINRQMCTAVTRANRQKHSPLNTYVSFYAPISGNDDELGDVTLSDVLISEKNQNPEELFIGRETADSMETRLYEALSDFERQVAGYYMQGEGYVEIAARLGKSPKSIDNALQRIKSKLSNLV